MKRMCWPKRPKTDPCVNIPKEKERKKMKNDLINSKRDNNNKKNMKKTYTHNPFCMAILIILARKVFYIYIYFTL